MRGRGCLRATPCHTGNETAASAPAWPSRTALVGASGFVRELPGSRQSPSPQLVQAHLEPGLLPSTGVTRFLQYCEPLRHLSCPSPDGTVAKCPRQPDRPPVLRITACVRVAPTTPASRSTFACRSFLVDLDGLRLLRGDSAPAFNLSTPAQ